MTIMNTKRKGIESGIVERPNLAVLRQLSPSELGQHYPRQYPTAPEPNPGEPAASVAAARLGAPLNIRQVANLVGCSPWSIRNTWIPRGLPHFRSGASSKLIFFTNQVVRWIERQQKGG